MTRKLKVLHIIKSLGRGGAETLLPETLKVHDKERFDFHYIYFLPWKDQMVADIKANGGNVVCFNSRNNIQLMLKVGAVCDYVEENEIELIHAHLPWAGVLARIVGKRTAVPVIYTEHNKQERYHFATRAVNLATINLADEVVAVSSDVEDSIRKNKHNLKTSVQTLVNGVNTVHFNKAGFDGNVVKKKLGIPGDSPVIGTIAVFRTQKRLDIWLDQARAILQQHENAHFIVVGDGPLKDQLMQKRDQLGLTARVHMPGLEQEVRPYLAAFDVFMMSSRHEGLPIALLEAMSMGCPVVATTAGGISEVVRDGKEGLLCSVEQPEKLADNVIKLLLDHDLRTSLGLNARSRIETGFSMRKMVQELEDLYLRLHGQVGGKGNAAANSLGKWK